MTLLLILGVLGALLLTVSLRGHLHRLGREDGGYLRPACVTGPWFAVGGVLFATLVWGGWVPGLIGLVAGFALFYVALGWDEMFDMRFPGFYACLRRELYSFFATPIPYFVLFLFIFMSGFFFYEALGQSRLLTLRFSYASIAFLGFFLFPLLTMGLLSRERGEGTIEVLMTAPISDLAVVLSKFLATLAYYSAMLLPTVAYYAILRHIGDNASPPVPVDTGPVLTGALGMLLMGGFFASLGLMTSSFTSSQILAALLSWVLIILFLLTQMLSQMLGLAGTPTGDLLEFLNSSTHLEQFLKGVVDPKEVLYFVSFTVFFLFLTVRSLEGRKWR